MPTATPALLAVHLPKTAGTWVKRAWRRVLGDNQITQIGGGHDPFHMVNDAHLKGRTVFGTVRNPWSWYCSWWEHALNNNDAQWRSMRVYGDGSIDFRGVLRAVTQPTEARTPDRIGVLYDLPGVNKADFLASGLSLYAYTIAQIYGGVQVFLDTAQLYEGMAELTGIPEERWREVGPANTRRQRGHGRFRGPPDYRDLYDEEMVGWVAESEAELVDLMGYTPFGPARAPVVYL